LIDELYSPELTIESARSLALLTLSFATKQFPGGVGEPFEIIIVNRGDSQISKPEVHQLDAARLKMQSLLESMRKVVF